MRPLPPEIRELILALPKTETHLHIEGAVPLAMVQAALPGRFSGEPKFWHPAYRFESFDAFSDLFAEVSGAVFTSVEAYHACALEVFAGLKAQNCKYIETSMALGALVRSRLDGPSVIEAIRSAAPARMEVRVFMGMRHNEYAGLGQEIIDDSLGWQDLAGFDLHGPEYLPLEPWTAKLWQKSREAGKFNKAHAGEFMPAWFIKRCVEELGITRIEHGVRAVEDPEVVQLLADKQITLDVCPISNVKLAVDGIPEMAFHPIKQLMSAGVPCTINTDDPFFFGNRLIEEYEALAQHLGFQKQELLTLARNGFEVALVEPEQRESWIAEIEELGAEESDPL